MVVTLMCARGPTPHVERGRKTLRLHGFLYKHMGKLQRAVTLILRRESKFPCIKSLVSTHSACPCYSYSTGPGIYGSKPTRVRGRSPRTRAVYVAINPWQPCYNYLYIPPMYTCVLYQPVYN